MLLREFIYKWNINYPIDRWWRDKYRIAFNSPAHRDMCFIDMRLEFEEDQIYKELNNRKQEYTPGEGDWLRKRKEQHISQKEIEYLYDKIDLENIKIDEKGTLLI